MSHPPREDFAEANLCGRTAEWCLAAPSTSTNYKNNGQVSTYQGTSPATARVTGTAVLVQAAYPWMKNYNLVQTILGTAKDFEDIARESPTYKGIEKYRYKLRDRDPLLSGRDKMGDYYLLPEDMPWEKREVIKNHHGKNITRESGWGLLDTEAATKGYGGFYWDDVSLDTQGTELSVFSNDLKGDKGFTKKGEGRLVFTGNNSYKGDSILEGGSLEINGQNGPSAFKVNAGELTGYGSLASITQTGGYVNNEGNLTVNGDYTMNISDANKDKAGFKAKFGNMMTVNGKVTLGGTLDLTGETKEGIITKEGNVSTVLRGKKGIDGTFANHVSSNPLFGITKVEVSPEVDEMGIVINNNPDAQSKDVLVHAYRKQAGGLVSSVPLTQSGQSVADNLDKVLSKLDDKQAGGTLNSQEKAFAERVFEAFAGMNAGSANTLAQTLSTTATNAELYKLDPTIYVNSTVNAIEQSVDSSNTFAQRLSTLKQGSFWAEAAYEEYDLDQRQAISNRKGTHQSVGIGTDLGGIKVGAQFDSSQLDVNQSVYGVTNKADTKLMSVSVGASKSLGNDNYLSGFVKGSVLDGKATYHNGNKTDLQGKALGVGLQLGKHNQVTPKLSVNPFVSANYHHYDHDDKVMNDGINTIHDIDVKQLQLGLGVNANYQVTPNLELYGGLSFYEAVKRDATINTNYTGTDTALSFNGWDIGKDKYKATLGLNHRITPNNTLSLSYDYAGSEHTDSSQVKLGLVSRF
ncbi:autotransporter domain-containing protein [Moraxella lacunata]|uniref:autotransporter domain-containing protein n=1 Tax=Moraxella lacunata TaxID=477 RepID=UPI0015F1385F|nr:autotransporter domain-containing protein [Moraxella lacunata]